MSPDLPDEDVDRMCGGLVQNAAKIRYLREVLKIPVQRKPNGRPLVMRADVERRPGDAQNSRATNGPNWSKAA